MDKRSLAVAGRERFYVNLAQININIDLKIMNS